MRPLLKRPFKLLYINQVCYSPTILAAKLTILLQLMRIFVPTKRGLMFRIIEILIWSNVCFYLANVLSVIFQCSPVPKAWNASVVGHCIATNLNLLVTGAMNVLSDVLILTLPLWTIWHLKLPTQKKLSVSAAFAAGIFANFAGIMYLAYSVQIIHGSDLTFKCIPSISLANGSALPGSPRSRQPSSMPRYPSSRNSSTSSTKNALGLYPASRPQGSISSESGLRPPRFSPEPFVWRDSGRGIFSASAKEEQVVVAGAYVPADEELALVRLDSAGKAIKDGQVSWYERMEGEEGIRKTVRIEQSY